MLSQIFSEYLEDFLSFFKRECRYTVLAAFGEEHLGDFRFYDELCKKGPIFNVLCKRKLYNPLKWIQCLSGLVFTFIELMLFSTVDILLAPVSLLLGFSIHWLKNLYLHITKKPLSDKSELKTLIKLIQHNLTFIPRYLIFVNICFIRNPLESLLSPINRVIHPFKKQSLPIVALVVGAVAAAALLSIGLYVLFGFAFFSQISVLVFFPALVNAITGFAGPLAMEIISCAITSFNMMGVIFYFFEDPQKATEKRQRSLDRNASVTRSAMNLREVEPSVRRIQDLLADSIRRNVSEIYYEPIPEEGNIESTHFLGNEYKPKKNIKAKYWLFKMLDIDWEIRTEKCNTPRVKPSPDLI